MGSRRKWTPVAMLPGLMTATVARAGEPGEARRPMPEPILEETTTDIDGVDAGEVEIEANAVILRSRLGGAFDLQLSPEFEWLVTRRLGVKVEPFFERGAATGGAPSNSGGVGGGLSWKLVQDFKHDFHLQAEVDGRLPTDVSTVVEPGESPLPLSFDLRSGFRRGAWTLRNSVGVSTRGSSAQISLRVSAALLTDFEPTGRLGFWGVEVEADGARSNPVVVALDLVPDLAPAGLPFALGFALPYSVGANGTAPSYGFFVRLFIESARESAYARTGLVQP